MAAPADSPPAGSWCRGRAGLSGVSSAIGFFSPYPTAALRRIAAWRSWGPLPIPVDVTTAFVEIRLRDPFFRTGMAEDDTLESAEMLAMLYSMAIMRLVNGFMEDAQKKTGRSISELAEAVGISRVLVDIRHESSHRNLPSLRLLCLAAIKGVADGWCSHGSEGERGRRADAGWRTGLAAAEKTFRETDLNYVCRFYHACPSEVVSVLLDFFQLDAPESSENSDVHQTDSLDVNQLSDVQNQISKSDIKTIIIKLSEKEPRLLIGILKSAIEMIETGEGPQLK